jgi:hypothetical protein
MSVALPSRAGTRNSGVAKAVSRGKLVSVTAIAVELDQKLRELDPKTAASVEQLVRDALQLAGPSKANGSSWPTGFWQQIREE